MTQPATLVTFLLDKSGSMNDIKRPTMEAFNAYVTGLKQDDSAGIRFSLVQFDTLSTVTTWKHAEMKDVGALDDTNYQPQGGTPLIDAAFKTIKAVERKVAEYAVAPKVVICIQTDGEENSSREHTWDDLNALIKEKIGLGWQFNFMGVGLDSYTQANRMGIAMANTVAYNQHDGVATMDCFMAEAANTVNYARGMASSTARSLSQKMAAGDMFDPALSGKPLPPTPAHDIFKNAPVLQRSVKPIQPATIKGHVDDIEL